METIMKFINLLQQGGAVMYVIAVFSVYTLAVILLKLVQFFRVKPLDARVQAVIGSGAETRLLYHQIPPMESLPNSPLTHVAIAALKQLSHPDVPMDIAKDDISRVATRQVQPLETHLRGLELTANISPLLGLLGTVIGMVQAFATLENAGARVDPSLLAGGIWTALLTTVFGLCVAIPAMAAHNIIDGKISRLLTQMEDLAVRILALRPVPGSVPKPIQKPIFAAEPPQWKLQGQPHVQPS